MAQGAGSQPRPRPNSPGPGLPPAPGPAVASAGAPGAPPGRPAGRSGVVGGSGQAGRRPPGPGCRGGGRAHLLQVAQQLRGLLHVAGLGLPHAVQDGVESLLVEQGPLGHSGGTSGPRHPPPGLSLTRPRTQHRLPAAGLAHPHMQGRVGGAAVVSLGPDARGCLEDARGRFPAPLCVPRSGRLLPAPGRSGGTEARSGERGGKTKFGGPGSGPGPGAAPQSRPRPAPSPPRRTCSPSSPSRPPGGPAPGPPSSAPGLWWPRSMVLSGPGSVSPRPPGPSFPSPEETARLIGGHARPSGGSEARQRRWGTGGHGKQAWGCSAGPQAAWPGGGTPAWWSRCLQSLGSWGDPPERRVQTLTSGPGVAQRTQTLFC